MKVLITGGHFSPALSVINKLKSKADIFVIGRKRTFEGDRGESFEYKVCKELNIPFETIVVGRLQRKFTIHTIPSIIKFPIGIVNSLFVIHKVKPDVVLTFGGYIGFSVGIAAFILRVPIVLHEQTQRVGISNKIISLFAKKICVSFESSKKYLLKHKIILTGNPLREEIFKVEEKIDVPKGSKIIYITGGSSGSHFINEEIAKILPKLLDKFTVIHQTGDSKVFNDYDRLEKYRESLPQGKMKRYVLRKFIFPSEIGWVLKNSDLIVSRSGANIISEILALSVPCLLIPLPFGQIGEQLENAKLIKKVGLGDFLEQKDVTGDLLFNKILEMVENEEKYKGSNSAKEYVFRDASEKIAEVTLQAV